MAVIVECGASPGGPSLFVGALPFSGANAAGSQHHNSTNPPKSGPGVVGMVTTAARRAYGELPGAASPITLNLAPDDLPVKTCAGDPCQMYLWGILGAQVNFTKTRARII